MRCSHPHTSLWLRGLCLLLAVCYVACLSTATFCVAPSIAAEGSIASLELVPRAESPSLSPTVPAIAPPSPEISISVLQSWESLFPILIAALWAHLFLPPFLRKKARMPRPNTGLRGFLPLPAAPPVA